MRSLALRKETETELGMESSLRRQHPSDKGMSLSQTMNLEDEHIGVNVKPLYMRNNVASL